MKEKNLTKREFIRCLSIATASLCLCTALFSGLADTAVAANLEQPKAVPTGYPAVTVTDVSSKTQVGEVSKADYKIADDTLSTDKPSAQSVSRDTAAGLGAKMIEDIYGINLDGATVTIGYYAATETFPRAVWSGSVRPEGSKSKYDDYYFSLDALTGERYTCGNAAVLDVRVDLGPDMQLQKNPTKYVELAKTAAEQYKLLSGEIKSAEYNSQGYVNDNNPCIAIDVYGPDGENALVGFSRYNQKLLSVVYPAHTAISEAALERLLDELYAQMDKQRAANGDSGGTGLVAVGQG